jgi:hypothetical protein
MKVVAFCEMHHIYDDKVDMSQSKLAGLLNAELTEILVKIATKVKENNEFDARFKIDFLNRIDTEYNVHLDYLEEKYPVQVLMNGSSHISEHLADQLIEKIKGKPIQAPRPSQIIAEKPSLYIERPDTQLNQPENILNFQKYVRNLDNGMLVVDIETPDVNDRRILSIGIAFWDKNTGDISPFFYQKTKPYNFQTVNKAAWTFRNGYLNYEEFVNMPETDYKALRCTDPVTNKDIGLSELFSRYPATGFNVSRFDFPALKAAGIVSESLSVPFDLGDICKHLFKGRTHQVSEQEAYRLLFNDGNYCEKHDAIIDAMDEAKILNEIYKIYLKPKFLTEINGKKINKDNKFDESNFIRNRIEAMDNFKINTLIGILQHSVYEKAIMEWNKYIKNQLGFLDWPEIFSEFFCNSHNKNRIDLGIVITEKNKRFQEQLQMKLAQIHINRNFFQYGKDIKEFLANIRTIDTYLIDLSKSNTLEALYNKIQRYTPGRFGRDALFFVMHDGYPDPQIYPMMVDDIDLEQNLTNKKDLALIRQINKEFLY